MSKVKITIFTDPLCPWCWGEEPFLRKLETHFPQQIEFDSIMGGLVEDLNKERPESQSVSDYYANFNKEVVEHTVESEKKHHMPVDMNGVEIYSEQKASSFLSNIAYKAAQLAAPHLADLFLYNLRAAAFAERRDILDEGELMNIADETGIDIAAFLEHMNDGSAQKKFEEDFQLTASSDIEYFPTFFFEYEGKTMKLKSYRTYEELSAVVKAISKGNLTPAEVQFTPESLLAFMQEHPKMAAEEIRLAFNLATIEEVEKAIEPLLESGMLQKKTAGTSFFVVKPSKTMSCDLTTGICTLG